jgi:ribosomal protein S18 acetylase RimI-like enzyme
MSVEIRLLGAGDEHAVLAARPLFDHEPEADATRRFLAEPTHHLLVAYDAAGVPVGFVSGVEMTHPDKGTEMFLYELGVDEATRRQGIGRALVEALAALAEERGCYDMWTGTDIDNVAARAAYARAGGRTSPAQLIFEWDFGGAARQHAES